MKAFNSYRKKFSPLYAAVRSKHATSPHQHHGHGLDHDVAVAQMAVLIAPTSRLADMCWVAALIHSTDRLMEVSGCPAQLREYLGLLPVNFFSEEEIEEIYLAVLEHSEKTPSHRSPTQEILQDADKLINLQATVLIRSGQFRSKIPAIEYPYVEKTNPASTYHAPRSVLDGCRISIYEYPQLINTQKGKELAFVYVERFRQYEQQILEDHQLLGLVGVEL